MSLGALLAVVALVLLIIEAVLHGFNLLVLGCLLLAVAVVLGGVALPIDWPGRRAP